MVNAVCSCCTTATGLQAAQHNFANRLLAIKPTTVGAPKDPHTPQQLGAVLAERAQALNGHFPQDLCRLHASVFGDPFEGIGTMQVDGVTEHWSNSPHFRAQTYKEFPTRYLPPLNRAFARYFSLLVIGDDHVGDALAGYVEAAITLLAIEAPPEGYAYPEVWHGPLAAMRLATIMSHHRGEPKDFSRIRFHDIAEMACSDVLHQDADPFVNADCSHADFAFYDFNGRDCYGANFQHARFHRTDAQSVHFAGADFRGASLTETDFRFANLTDANLCGATAIDSSNWESAYLTGAKIDEGARALFKGAIFG